MDSSSASWHRDFGIDRATNAGFFSNANDLRPETPHSHDLRQAFDLLGLDGVLCSDQTPLIYFKQMADISLEQGIEIHRRFWNHGTAPILVLVGPDQAYVYSGMARPQSAESSSDAPDCLVEQLSRAAAVLESFVTAVQTGVYFRQHGGAFETAGRVDRDLLSNLSNTRDVLRQHATGVDNTEQLDALLCRIVFACYLFDRKVIGRTYLEDVEIQRCAHLRDILAIRPLSDAKDAIYRLFEQLGDDFNGDLFSDDLDAEKNSISESHIRTLFDFFQGTDVRTGQARFWPYDFGCIPIETISAIYEHFLKKEASQDGAIYTPRSLASVVLDTALDGTHRLIGKTFLDPACGSGIFLVALFNRLAFEWTKANPDASNLTRAEKLMQLLRRSLFGVDKSAVACRITAFSLYLAYLDQLSPRDIRSLRQAGPVLPHLVGDSASNNCHTRSGPRNILCEDFFTLTTDVARICDFIVGNPPWGSRTSRDTPAIQWCAENRKPIPDRQIAAAFVWKAIEHATPGGALCFVLPHGTLFNHGSVALKFQRAWFGRYRIERILNLTDLRFYVFRDARHPAIVVRYRNAAANEDGGAVDYQVPKVSWPTVKADIITMGPGERVSIPVSDVLTDLETADAPQVWNRHTWATPRDVRLLDRLKTLPRLRDHVRAPSETSDGKRWVRAEGFQPLGQSDNTDDAKWLDLPSRRFIGARSSEIDLFLDSDSCELLPASTVRVRQKSNSYTDVYRGPHVLITHGFQRIAYADFDVSFRHAIRGIHGPDRDKELLMFLACYLRTDLARYFAFHTSSNWGVYRPKVHVQELLRLPFPLPEQRDDPKRSWAIVNESAEILQGAHREARTDFLRRGHAVAKASVKLEALVNDYFDLQESDIRLIADTVEFVLPSVQARPGRTAVPSLTTSGSAHSAQYTERLCATLNHWARSSGYVVRGSSIVSASLGVGVAVLEKVRQGGAASDVPHGGREMLQVLRRIRDVLSAQSEYLNPMLGLMVFDASRLYILKPATLIHWSDTAALNDADVLASALLSRSAAFAE